MRPGRSVASLALLFAFDLFVSPQVVRADNLPPQAVIQGGGAVECPAGAALLDGSGSSDPGGSIASYEWIEDYGTPFAHVLGTGPTVFVFVPPLPNFDGRFVTLKVTDGEGASDTETVQVYEVDTTPPQVGCPGPIMVECAGPVATPVAIPPITAFDACAGGDISYSRFESPSNVPFASNNFVYGTTTVSYFLQPDFGPGAPCVFTVTVQDTTPPQIACPAPVVAECGGPETTHVNLTAVTATDACSPGLTLLRSETPENVPVASDNYVYGTTTLTYTAQPGVGPSAHCDLTVTVQDTTPPELSVSTNPVQLWPANHQLRNVVALVSAGDVCGEATYVLSDVTSSEPDPADIVGAEIGTPDVELQLRAERDGSTAARTYTVTYEAIDSRGLRSSTSAFVRVPTSKDRVKVGPPVEP